MITILGNLIILRACNSLLHANTQIEAYAFDIETLYIWSEEHE